jgi:hypothetical protein
MKVNNQFHSQRNQEKWNSSRAPVAITSCTRLKKRNTQGENPKNLLVVNKTAFVANCTTFSKQNLIEKNLSSDTA